MEVLKIKLLVVQLDTIHYEEALQLQQHLVHLRQKDLIPDILLLLEHSPVITIGKSGSDSNILLPEQWLKKEGIYLRSIERGGDVTYHGPGQLVGYPIIDLSNYGKSIKQYIHNLEEVFICLLQEKYDLRTERDPSYIGVWSDEEKILAIGVAVKRWVTMHGFALNVNTDLEYFSLINPCGIIHKGVTSLDKLMGEPVDMDEIRKYAVQYFSQVFHREPHLINREQLEEIIGWDRDAQKETGVAENTITSRGRSSQSP